MSRSSGTYTAPVNSFNPAVEGTVVDETDWNSTLDDIEAALTESVYTAGLGSTDNRLLRTDGTDTKKAQGSSITADDDGGLTMPGSLMNTEGALTLANGANSNITLPVGRFITITGPTGSFSISGFASPANGREIVLYNSVAQNMTITNDATSTAANRILTLTGSDVALTGVCVAKFTYSAVSSRWILTGTQG